MLDKALLDYIKTNAEPEIGDAAIDGRTWDECELYIISRAYTDATTHKYGRFATCTGLDETLVGYAVHYFTEENLEEWKDVTATAKVTSAPAPVAPSKPKEPTLFDVLSDSDKPKASYVPLKPKAAAKVEKPKSKSNAVQIELF